MISALVIHLDLDERLARDATSLIEATSAIEVGSRHANRLPVVLETATPAESQKLTDWLIDLPGVTHVDVTYVHLEESDDQRVESKAS